MITNITLQNFKCFRELEVNPKLITVLIGPNGTGKSSVLQSLLLLKQSVGAERINHQGEFINLSDPTDMIPNFLSEPLPIQIGFQGNIDTDPGLTQPEFCEEAHFRYSASFFSDLTPAPSSALPKAHSAPGFVLEQLRVVPAARGLVRLKYALGNKSEETFSKLLKKVIGTGLLAKTVPPQSVEVKSVTPSGAVNIEAEGFGANALVLLFHTLLTAEKGATILIEEPEIHLHPKAQAELAEVLADTAKAEDKQIIMTTHSEYIAGRLLTLVAENRLTTDELAIYYFEKDEKGECFASEIEVTERGQTKGGLTGFHEATRDEMRRYVDGLRNRA